MSEKPDKEYSTEQEQITIEDAKRHWAKMNEKKFPDDMIGVMINAAYTGTDKEWNIANALTAQAMIAYNEMIDEKISKAKKSWGIY
jgi:hypothetical protein